MPDTRRPPLGLLLLEGQRALLEGLSIPATRRLLKRAPRGEGQPVLVLPGFMAGDDSTRILRRFLKERGYSAHPWLQGRNRGPGGGVREALRERVSELAGRYGQKISIVGWSLGGIYARELAKHAPDQIRQVISLGSPFADVSRPSNATRTFDFVSRREERAPDASRRARAREIQRPTPTSVPSTAIFTKTDGVVHWRACLEPVADHTENIEVPGSHCGLGHNPLVLYAVADRLSQPEGLWRPFDFRGWRGRMYRPGHQRPAEERAGVDRSSREHARGDRRPFESS
jgi:pimeloyl-ACP methyl ester carboxylesterase